MLQTRVIMTVWHTKYPTLSVYNSDQGAPFRDENAIEFKKMQMKEEARKRYPTNRITFETRET